MTATYFNPRSREGSDRRAARTRNTASSFQSTLPRRERRRSPRPSRISASYFNPRSREGSDMISDLFRQVTAHFNPRSREGSDGWYITPDGMQYISIHAPAKGATSRGQKGKPYADYFNPRSREGSDHLLGYSSRRSDDISIHAPAKGATPEPETLETTTLISIHAPAKGATRTCG